MHSHGNDIYWENCQFSVSACKYMDTQHATTLTISCNHMARGVMLVNRCPDCCEGVYSPSIKLILAMVYMYFKNNLEKNIRTVWIINQPFVLKVVWCTRVKKMLKGISLFDYKGTCEGVYS